MSKFKTVIAVGRKAVTKYHGTHATITMNWVLTLECGHKRFQSQLGRSSHSDRMKCEVKTCGQN